MVAIHEKYMLTIREAAAYFNIGIKNMRRLCESNEGEFSIVGVLLN
ncbi:excisionase [Lachnospiraceae bacterium HCP1S3_C3]